MISISEGKIALANYLAYALPCMAAVIFGLGTLREKPAGATPQARADAEQTAAAASADSGGRKVIIRLKKTLKSILFDIDTSDQQLFNISGIFLYFGLLCNTYASACSWPGTSIYLMASAIPLLPTAYIRTDRLFWRGKVACIFGYIFIALLTLATIAAISMALRAIVPLFESTTPGLWICQRAT